MAPLAAQRGSKTLINDTFYRPNLTVFAAQVVALALFLVLDASAGDPDTSSASGPLDGMVFAGHLGPADNPDRADRLYFDEGKFWSEECTRCGFEPGTYWVRHVDGGIAFRGVLQSADVGRFTYEGFMRDGRIDVSINWVHERWYWTIDRDLRFVGEAVTGETAGMTIDEAWALANGEPRSDRCPS